MRIANQKACFGAMLQHIVGDRIRVTSELICEIHKYLTQGTYDERRWREAERPGTFKIHDYCVADGRGTTGGCSDGNTGARAKRWRTSRIVARIYGKLQHIRTFANLRNIHAFGGWKWSRGRTLMNSFPDDP